MVTTIAAITISLMRLNDGRAAMRRPYAIECPLSTHSRHGSNRPIADIIAFEALTNVGVGGSAVLMAPMHK
jgi:hypothetical protein